jgi:hypothetical protein
VDFSSKHKKEVVATKEKAKEMMLMQRILDSGNI